ncbi:MAG: hypothetical protein IMZ65_00690, partial [Planctomycetes bacterium]|nr:hypothetical protein [Planctomycetota bacterium]
MIAMKPKTRRAARKGIALLITMIFLALFACLAVAIASAASSTLVVARNRTESQQAAALAESGLQIVQRSLGGMAVSTGADASVLLAAIAGQLESTFQSSTMFDADDITSDVETVAVPTMTITRPDGRTGQINLMITASGGASDDTTITITSIGAFGGAARTVSCNMTVQRGRSVIMDYGIASKGAVQLTGNARITGAADPAHGNILSATYSTEQAVRMTGNGATSGDVAICNPNGQIVKTGNVHIGGQEVKGAPEPEWPQVDISEFRQYATNVY